jgi:hypothetical protein
MLNRLVSIIGLLIFFIFGCYPVSHIVVGEKKAPINASDVRVYVDYPQNYEKIAIIEASSDFALKDPSFDFTHQRKTDKALNRLKNEAALLGANGIVIENLSTNIKQNLNVYEDDEGRINTSSQNEKQKEVKAIAIFVE